MRVTLHKKWFPEPVVAKRVSHSEWQMVARDGQVKATAVKRIDGMWLATMNSKLCGEGMNFLTCLGETPEAAIEGLFDANTAYAKSILEEIGTIAEGIEFPFPEPAEEAEAVSADILAAI